MDNTVSASNVRTEPTTLLGDNNRIIPAIRVTFDLSDGNTHYIDVPRSSFNAASVQTAIEAELAAINSIKQAFTDK